MDGFEEKHRQTPGSKHPSPENAEVCLYAAAG